MKTIGRRLAQLLFIMVLMIFFILVYNSFMATVCKGKEPPKRETKIEKPAAAQVKKEIAKTPAKQKKPAAKKKKKVKKLKLDESDANKEEISAAENGKTIVYGTWYKKEKVFVPAKKKTKDDCIGRMIAELNLQVARTNVLQAEVDFLYNKLGRIAVQTELQKGR